MADLLQLFLIFFMIGFVSFGGGYAMIPLMQSEFVNRFGWLTPVEFTDLTAIAGMSPGPIATNIAVAIGYNQAEWAGAIAATLGIVLPSVICVILLTIAAHKMQKNQHWNNALYGIRAVVTGFIIYSAILFSKNNHMFSQDLWYTASQILLFVGCFISLMYYKKHPVYVIIISALVGIALYS